MSPVPAPILVAACGNRLAGDDAFGPLLVELLQREPIEGVEALDLGMNPGGLLDALQGAERTALVIADAAVVPDAAPGTLVDCIWNDTGRPALAHERAISTHGLSIADQVELARSLGLLPEVVRLIALTTAQGSGSGSPQPIAPTDIMVRQLTPARQRIAQFARVARVAREVLVSTLSPTETRYA